MAKCLDCKKNINTDVEDVIYDNNGECVCGDCWDIIVDEEHNCCGDCWDICVIDEEHNSKVNNNNLSNKGGVNVK